jgi:glutamate/tyrosine decarboxylase-like PLP-dependent enzyme
MDPDALWETVKSVTSRRIPIHAPVSICGSPEEGAVDRLDRLVAVRTRAEKELGVTFHLHSDACYGGYAASVTWRANGQRRTAREVAASLGGPWLSEEWLSAYSALSEADSITVDPHKLGYVPYPAGAILFRDKRSRDLVAVDPPYLIPAQGRREGSLHDEEMLGRYIFEGSKPGAAAASVWLSHKVVPLDERGHGHLVERTVAGARRLYDALATSELGRYRVILLPPPDLNIVCYLVMHDGLKTLAEVNEFNEAIYRQLSPARPDRAPDLIITRTHLCTPMYDGAVDPLLARLGCVSVEEWRAAGPAGLVVLRSTVMDPFFVSPPPAPDHVTSYLQALREACDAAATSTGSMA